MTQQVPPLLDVVDHYRSRGILQTVDGRGDITNVTNATLAALGLPPGDA